MRTKVWAHKTKKSIPSIDIVAQMWLGFPIHEAVASQRGKEIIHEHRTNEEFAQIGTPSRQVIEFKTLRRAFPRVPHERPVAVPGHHLYFIQVPRQEKVDPNNRLSNGFHITIRFDYAFKSITRQQAKNACLERLRTMDIPSCTVCLKPARHRTQCGHEKLGGIYKCTLTTPKPCWICTSPW